MAENLREIKANLAEAFPAVRFTYDTAGRGRAAGPRISWTGGPNTTTVSQAAGGLRHKRGSVTLHFNRTPTPDELAAIEARQAQEHAEWLADAPNREARHKAAIAEKRRLGAAKAAEARARNAEREAALAAVTARWPGVAFTVYEDRALAWEDGPSEADVRASGVVPGEWRLDRDESEEARRKLLCSTRPARKQAKRAEKTARVRKAIARYPLALADAGCRRNHLSAQIALPIELPRRRAA
jgi:hypothetical protein